jgi:single-strand DNA-binding protein
VNIILTLRPPEKKKVSKSLNQVNILGNLTRDPELRQTPSGQSVTNFSVALNRSYKDAAGEWQEATDFVDVVAWGALGERVDTYLGRGSRALITGRIQSRQWEQDGVKRNKVEILASDVIFLDNRNESEGASSSTSNKKQSLLDNSDIPY